MDRKELITKVAKDLSDKDKRHVAGGSLAGGLIGGGGAAAAREYFLPTASETGDLASDIMRKGMNDLGSGKVSLPVYTQMSPEQHIKGLETPVAKKALKSLKARKMIAPLALGGMLLGGLGTYAYKKLKKDKKMEKKAMDKTALSIGLPELGTAGILAGTSYLGYKKFKKSRDNARKAKAYDKLTKKASEEVMDKEAKKKEANWFERQKGVMRAGRRSNKGVGKYLAHDKLVSARSKEGGKGAKKGLGYGAALGTGAGLLASLLSKGRIKATKGAGLGAIGGTVAGGLTGGAVGVHKGEKKYFKKRGVKLKYGGFDAEFDSKAKKKYLNKKAEVVEEPVVEKQASYEADLPLNKIAMCGKKHKGLDLKNKHKKKNGRY